MNTDSRAIEMDAEIRSAKARLYVVEAMLSRVFCRLAELESMKIADAAEPNLHPNAMEETSSNVLTPVQ
jgi:hypothetical protein